MMRVLIKGAGDLASGIAYVLWKHGHEIIMTDLQVPLAVRRMVSFSRAIYEKEVQIEDANAVLVSSYAQAKEVLAKGKLAILVDERAAIRMEYQPHVLVDAIMAKKNTGTSIADAPIVIGIGPGFCAQKDCHYVIETMRGHSLGKVIAQGSALPNTGIPGEVGGFTRERLLQASADGIIEPLVQIGDIVEKGDIVARTGGVPVYAKMSGIVRGMLQQGVKVTRGLKIGDIDARKVKAYCYTFSDKSLCIGEGVQKALQLATAKGF